MDFSIRLARAAAWMTWLCLIVSLGAVLVMDQVGTPNGLVIHPVAYYLWAVFGVAATVFLTVLPNLAMKSHFVLKNITVFRVLLLVSDTLWATGGTAVTGGIEGPFWVCYLGVVLSSSIMSRRLTAMASATPRSSDSMPGNAAGVSTNTMIGRRNFSASSIARSAFRYPSGRA